LDSSRLSPQSLADHLDRPDIVRSDTVELVDEADPRHAIFVRLPPDRLRLGLDTLYAVEDDDTAVEDAERTLNFDRKVDVPRCIDNVDTVIPPKAGRRRSSDRDAAFSLRTIQSIVAVPS